MGRAANFERPKYRIGDDRTLLAVLDAVDGNSAITQRSIASELDIALGLANSYLKRCVKKGLVKVSTVPARRYAYYLTPQGFAEKSRLTGRYLSDSFSFFRQAGAQCSAAFAKAASDGQKRLLLIGEGELAQVASLVVRDHAVEIVAVIAAVQTSTELRRQVKALGPIDGVIITALSNGQQSYEAAVTMLGLDRVHAPELLRIRSRKQAQGRAP